MSSTEVFSSEKSRSRIDLRAGGIGFLYSVVSLGIFTYWPCFPYNFYCFSLLASGITSSESANETTGQTLECDDLSQTVTRDGDLGAGG